MHLSVVDRRHFAKTIFTNQSRNTVFLKVEFAPIFKQKCVIYFDSLKDTLRGFLQILTQSPLFKNETESENNYPGVGGLSLCAHIDAREITRVNIF